MSRRAESLHHSPWQGVFYLTGGGSSFMEEILTTAGASRSVLEVRVPYANAALSELLGAEPEQACSEATARALAMGAFQRARLLGAEQPFGFACTASLATDRVKRGAHRAHAAIQTAEVTYTAHWPLTGSRAQEERMLAEQLWSKLGQALHLPSVQGAADIRRTTAQPAWQALILGEALAVATAAHEAKLLMPGAFNPLHEGHRQMLAIAERLTGLSGAYELSVANVDKPFLDYREIESRLAQFDRPVWLTRLPTFIEKARRFPGATFVVGLDTLLRIADPRYYGNTAIRDEVLLELDERDIRYVVFGREVEGKFRTLSDVAETLPRALLDRSTEVGAEVFSNPVSSSQLRQSSD